jgi:AraC-like DNA-binding protein
MNPFSGQGVQISGQGSHERFSLASLSEEYGMSVSHLSHLFKRITGNSVMGYLLSCRLAGAKKYLAETPMEIGHIVEKCGFTDASNFSRTFRRQTGLTPSQFRMQFSPAGARAEY